MGNHSYLPNEEQIEETKEKSPLAVERNTTEQPNGQKPRNKKPLRTLLCIGLSVLCFLSGMLVSWLSLDPEMRSLIRLKNAIQKDYYQTVTDDEFYNLLFGSINDEIFDQYSEYLNAEEFKEMRREGAGNQSGLGLVFQTNAVNEVSFEIARVCGNSPAELAGICEGDVLLAYGKTQTEMTLVEEFVDFSQFITACQAGEEIYLRLQTADTERTLAIAKAEYVENYVFYRTNTLAYHFTGEKATQLTQLDKPLSLLDDQTAYIRLTQFNGEAVEQFSQAMNVFKSENKKNLVLDLRDNGGGYLDILQSIAGYFCKSSQAAYPLVSTADYGKSSKGYYADRNVYDEYFGEDSRICVLADDGTASASEALIGCMLDYGAITYGDICLTEKSGVAKTYGKGIMQTTYPLSIFQGDAVKLTTAYIRWPLSDTCIHNRGILVADGVKTVVDKRVADEEIAGAITALGL